MLPVRVKSASSSPCSLSHASAFLQRFLSSDASSDSFVRGYAANVAHALQQSLPAHRIRTLTQVTSSENKPPRVHSPLPPHANNENEGFHSWSTSRKDKKKRRRSLSDFQPEVVRDSRNAGHTPEDEDVPDKKHDRKRRKEEKEKNSQNHRLSGSDSHSTASAGLKDVSAVSKPEEMDHVLLKAKSPDEKKMKTFEIHDSETAVEFEDKSAKREKKKDKMILDFQGTVIEQSKAGRKEKKKSRSHFDTE